MQKIKSCLLFLLLLLFFQCNMPTENVNLENAPLEGDVVSRAASLPAGFKIVGYEPDWAGSAADIRYDKITHLIHAFSNYPDAQGNIAGVPNSVKLTDAVSRGHAAGVKVLLAIGGWHNGNDQAFESLAANPTSRANFVRNCETLVEQYNLDGIDIDWEWPEVGASANNFAALMKELSTALKPKGKLVTAAIVPQADAVLDEVINYVDFLNLMVYDGGWSTGAQDHSTYQAAVDAINYWERRGVAANKIIIGVPFYSRGPSWGATKTYKQIVAADPTAPNKDESNGAHYNGIPTMKKKTELAVQRAGGIMIWELTQDTTDSTSLLNAINEAAIIGGGDDIEAPTVPSNLAGVGGEGTATLNWTASTDNKGVSGYKIFKDGAYLQSVRTNSAELKGLAAGTYSFTVSAYDYASNESAQSAAVSVIVLKKTTPDHPTWSRTEVYTTGQKVIWKGRIYKASWWNQGNEPGVSQWGPWEDLGPAVIDTQAPTVPSGVKALNVKTTSLTLEWTASTDDVAVTGYKVYNGTAVVADVTATSAALTGLTADTVYSFTVSAYDAAGNESAQSTALSVKTAAPVVDKEAPTMPANPAASNVTATEVTLNWSASTDNVEVAGYKVYNGTAVVADVTAVTAVITGLTPKTAYSFTVSAYDAAGNESAQSVAVAVTTKDQTGPVVEPWAEGVTYKLGDLVSYKGATYKCTFAHTSISVWTPEAAHALWARQ